MLAADALETFAEYAAVLETIRSAQAERIRLALDQAGIKTQGSGSRPGVIMAPSGSGRAGRAG